MKRTRRSLGVSLTAQAVLYPLCLIGAFIFAQALKRPISHMILWAVILLPLISVIQLALARAALRVSFRTSQKNVNKHTPFRISAVVANKAPLPVPFAEAVIMLPGDDGARCSPHRFAFSVMPLGTAHIEKSGMFFYLGEYSVGVTELYVYDCFRAVRLRIPVNKTCVITVMPRLFELPKKEGAAHAYDREGNGRSGDLDMIGIREYRHGDNPRRIHWKLTSKSDETVVKEYIGGEGAPAYILCDLHSPLPAETVEVGGEENDTACRACLDLIVESALSAAKRELELAGSAVIAWIDGGEIVTVGISTHSELDRAALRMCSVSFYNGEEQLSSLAEALAIPRDVSVIGVGCVLNSAVTAEFLCVTERCGYDGGSHEFIFCCDAKWYTSNGGDIGVLNGCRAQLLSNGVTVVNASDYAFGRRRTRN